MSSARFFLLLELSFLVGVGFGELSRSLLVSAGLVCGATFLILLPRIRFGVLLLCCAVAFGFVRFQQSESWKYHDGLVAFSDSTVTLVGTIVADVDTRLDAQRLTVRVQHLVRGTEQLPINGKILITTDRYPVYAYGETLTVRCRLVAPEPIDRFAYDEYLALARIYSLCQNPRITDVHRAPASIARTLYLLRQWMTDRIAAALPEPHAALLGGILLGAKRGLPDDLTLAFQRVGLSHIVALSGYNITILISAILGATVRIGGSRRHAFWLATIVMIGFVLMTGASASVVRAGIMGFLVCFARYRGRLSRIWYSLVFAATVMVLLNPRVLLHDVGFQLSFAATVGLVLFTSAVGRRIRFVPERFGLRDALASTLSATLATLPLLVTQFGRISLVGPLANLLVLPLVPLVMLLGVFLLLPFIASFAAPCVWGLLTWMLFCTEWLAKHAWASVSVPALPTWAPLGGYALGILCVALWRTRQIRLHEGP